MAQPLINVGAAANDGTGDALRTAFQKVNRLPNPDNTINPLSGDYSGTYEQKINAAIVDGVAQGKKYCWITQPYTPSLVTFNTGLRMIREGGNPAWFDVKAYGAVGDGVTNDSTAFVAAEAGARPTTGSTIYVPTSPGGYALGATGASSATAALTLYQGETLLGENAFDSFLTLLPGTNRSLIEINSSGQGVTIRDLRLEGLSASQSGTSHGIRMLGTGGYGDTRNYFQNLFIHDFLSDGFLQDFQASECSLIWVIVRNVGAHGFELNGSDNFFLNCQVNNAALVGYRCVTGFQHFVQCASFACGQYGALVATSATHCAFYNSDFDSSGFDNIYIQGSFCAFVAGVSRDPGQATTATYSHVKIDSSLTGIRIVATDFKPKVNANTALYCIRVNGVISASALGPNTYGAGAAVTANTLVAGAPGPDFFYGRPRKAVTLTYGATINTDATLGDDFAIIVTNATPFTIALPTNLPVSPDNTILTYVILNSSGGAMGTVTWAGNFLLAGAWVNPANTKRRTITFMANGTTLTELCRAAADI